MLGIKTKTNVSTLSIDQAHRSLLRNHKNFERRIVIRKNDTVTARINGTKTENINIVVVHVLENGFMTTIKAIVRLINICYFSIWN